MSPEGRKHRTLLIKLTGFALGMFVFAYAMVPLYNTFCDITGINGKTGGRIRATQAETIDTSRTIRLDFMVRNNKDMPWEFRADVPFVDIHPGEVMRVDFYAKNTTDKDMVAQSIPSVAPAVGAKYLKKTECFCFEHQPLKAGAEEHMPLVFFIDPNIPKDVEQLTLSYTLFDITDRQ